MPKLKELTERYGSKGFVLLAVHSDKDNEKGAAVVKELGMNFPIAYDPEGKLMKTLGCDSFPDYAIVDKKGILRAVDLANSEAETAVKDLLAE